MLSIGPGSIGENIPGPVPADGPTFAQLADGDPAAKSGSISGVKFHDLDANGVRDEGEPGLADWHVYVDLDDSGQWEPGEPDALTDADGSYVIAGLDPGTYTVAEELQPGWQQTFPAPGTGELSFVQVVRDGVDGLDGAHCVSVSPDGSHVYATAHDGDAVAAFSRDATTGQLSFVQAVKDGQDGVDGLHGANSVIISPDGEHVYAAGRYDDALTVFGRDPATGELTFVQAAWDQQDGIDGLDGATSVAVSPDGVHVYATAVDDGAVTVFHRNPATGELGFVQAIRDDAGGVDGLGGAFSVSLSPDGRHVYAAGLNDHALAVFGRDPATGELSFVQVVRDGSGGVDGLERASSVTVSPDGSHVYATGFDDDAVAVFDRDPATGELSFVEAITGGGGLDGPISSVTSGDGRHVYVAGRVGDAVSVFERDEAHGRLGPVQVVTDGADGVDGLEGAFSVTLDPGGRYLYAAGVDDDALVVFDRETTSPGTHQVDVADGQVVENVDFGNHTEVFVLGLDLPSDVTEGDGVVEGAVTVAQALAEDLVVALQVDDTSEVTVPAEVTIPAGQTRVAFDVTVLDDVELDWIQDVVVSASATAFAPAAVVISVHDNETATLTVTLPDAAAEGDGVLTGAGTVTADQAPTSDVVVELISGDVTEITVPETVTMPAGQSSASFDLTVVDDTQIDGRQSAVVVARVENWTDDLDTIEVADNETLDLVLTLPAEVWEGAGVLGGVGLVGISGTLTTDLVVSMISDDVTELAVPDSLTILAGRTSARFDLTVVDDADYDGAQTATVAVSAAGFNEDARAVTVRDDDVHHFVFGAVASPQQAGRPFEVRIEARDVDDDTVDAFAEVVQLSGSVDAGPVVLVPATTGRFVAGAWTGAVTVDTVDENVVLRGEDAAGHTGAGNAFDVVAAAANPFQRLRPLGGLTSVSRDNTGRVDFPGMKTEFAFFAEAGQTITAAAYPDESAAIMSVELVGLAGPVSADGPGRPAVLPPVTVSVEGTYAIRLWADTPGTFTLELGKNLALEVFDSDHGSELSIDGSFVSLGTRIDPRGRFAVLGTSDVEPGGVEPGGDAQAGMLTELIVNGGFETGDFTGWTALENALAELTPWTVGPAGTGYLNSSAPVGGTQSALNGFDGAGGLRYELYQDVAVPPLHAATLTTNHRIQYQGTGAGTQDRILQISLRDTDDNVLVTLYTETVAMELGPWTDLGWSPQQFDLSAYAGRTVRVHFLEIIPESFTGPANIEFDDISLTVQQLAQPDVDEFTLELIGKAGRPIDVVLDGQDDVDFSAGLLELLDTDGSTVLATAVAGSPDGRPFNYDLALLGFVVPSDGVYTLRITSTAVGRYGVVVTDSLAFESEPNNRPVDRLRSLDGVEAALGHLGTFESADLIVNGGFETGDFTGWTATSNGLEELTPWTVGPAGGGFFFNSSPLLGTFSAYNGFDGEAGLQYELYQDVTIPDLHAATLTTNHRIVYAGSGTGRRRRLLEISVRDADNDLLETLYHETISPGAAPETDRGWNAQQFDLSAYAGRTVRIHFAELIPETYPGPALIEFDGISLIVDAPRGTAQKTAPTAAAAETQAAPDGSTAGAEVSVTELVVNGSFETGDLTGWGALSNGLGELTPWTVGPAGGGFFFDSSPLGGLFSAYNGFDGEAGLQYELYQDVAIPAGRVAELTTNHRIVYTSGGTGLGERALEISLRDTADNVLQTLYTETIDPAAAPETDRGWNTQTFDLSPYAGRTVRIHFRELVPDTFSGPAMIEFDEISLAVQQPRSDWYEVTLTAGDRITVSTGTPFDAMAGLPQNDLDPALLVLDPGGSVAAADADSAPDGRNARADFVVTETGTYRIEVVAESGRGEYLLKVGPTIQVDVALVPVLIPSPPSLPGSALPEAIDTVLLGQTYYLEVWVQDTQTPGTGVTAGTVDVHYTTSLADAVEVVNLDFDVLPSGVIDDAGGLVDDLGGGTFALGAGVAPGWARLGYVEMVCTGVGAVGFDLSPGVFQFSRVGAGNVEWENVDLGQRVVVGQHASVQLDVALVRRPTPLDDPATGEVVALPQSEPWIHEWEPFWVELWASTPDTDGIGVYGGTVDLQYDGLFATADSIQWGPAFTEDTSGSVLDSFGIVDDVGGLATRLDVGADHYALLARVRFLPAPADQAALDEVGHFLGPYDLGLGLGDDQMQLAGHGRVPGEFGAVPTTELYAVPYDVDDNDSLDFGDFSYFSPAFGLPVGGPEPPYAWWADFDGSGQVDFGDFSYFTPHFQKSKPDDTLTFPPGFPPAVPAPAGGRLSTREDPLIEVVLVAVSAPSPGSLPGSALPEAVRAVDVGSTYYVEIWVRDTAAPGSGVSGGMVDFHYTTALADAAAAVNLDFDALTSGSIDEPLGLVDDLGGATFTPAAGVGGDWVRMAYVELAAAAAGEVAFDLSDGALQFSRTAAGNVPWDRVALGGSISVVQQEELYWDGQGPGVWGDPSRWLQAPDGPPAGHAPNEGTRAVIATDTVTIETDRTARALDVQSGAVVLAPGATLAVSALLEIQPSGQYVSQFYSEGHPRDVEPLCGLIEVAGDVSLAGTLDLQATDTMVDFLFPLFYVPGQWPGDDTLEIIRSQTAVTGTFDSVPDSAIFDPLPSDPILGHLGHGVFLTDHGHRGSGVTYLPRSVLVDVFQAAPGDVNGDRKIDSLDIQAILSANHFGNGTPADWTSGDFNGDRIVDSLDIQMILATDFFSRGVYAPPLSPAASEGAALEDAALEDAVVHDAALADAADGRSSGPTARSGKMDWLLDVQQPDARKKPSPGRAPHAAVVDRLMATGRDYCT